MSKKVTLENGFLLLYDWLPAFESLPAKEVKALLLALIARQREKRPLPSFSNPLTANYARMIEPSIKRRLDGATGARQGKEKAAAESDGGVGGTVGGGVAPLPPKQSRDKQSRGKRSKEKKTETNSLFPVAPTRGDNAPKGGEYARAQGADGGVTAHADTKKKNFYGYGGGGWSHAAGKTGRKSSEGYASSFDVDEFFEAAIANTYGGQTFE